MSGKEFRIKPERWTGKPQGVREDYRYVFDGYEYDQNGNILVESQRMKSNRANGKRYVKRKDRVKKD